MKNESIDTGKRRSPVQFRRNKLITRLPVRDKEGATALPPAWMASQATAARDQTDASCKIKRIKGPPIDRHDIAVGARLLDTWLGRVYASHLRQYSAVRRLADWVWRNGYPLYVSLVVVRFSNREEKGWRPLAKASEFAEKANADPQTGGCGLLWKRRRRKFFPLAIKAVWHRPMIDTNSPRYSSRP